jgi:hypothetical protein
MSVPLRRTRRLQDTLVTAAHRACDDGHLDIAASLLRLAEELVAEETDLRRRRHDRWSLLSAPDRLWHLRHGDPDQAPPLTAEPPQDPDAQPPTLEPSALEPPALNSSGPSPLGGRLIAAAKPRRPGAATQSV